MFPRRKTETESPSSSNVVAIETGLEVERTRSKSVFRRRNLLWFAGAALIIIGLYTWWSLTGMKHVTEAVTRGSLAVVVAGSGSAQPVKQVNISSETSGTIHKVFVDHNQEVKAGEALAELDTEKLLAAVENSRAKLEVAKVRVTETLASVEEKHADYERKKVLANVVSQRELQLAKFAYDRAVAQHGAALANIEVAKADLRINEINLARATIRSPVDGTVLKRNAEPGQLVVVSRLAAVLFVIAEDLHHLEIKIDVNEVEIDRVKIGQKANFAILAFPGRKFSAEVHDIRLSPEIVKGETVYKTILRVDNANHLIRPGMSARAEIVVQQIDEALLVPNAALNFSPSFFGQGGEFWRRMIPKSPQARAAASNPGQADQQQTVWILRDKTPVAVPVVVGASDGQRTEILGGDITVDQQVITGLKSDSREKSLSAKVRR
jgi:HlyD family secretion protein